MPHEILGADLGQPAGREAYMEVLAFTKQNIADYDFLYTAGEFTQWAHESPEEANDFLRYCIGHDNPHCRGFAGLIADDWKDISANELVFDVMITAMRDTDYIVLDSIIPYYYDVLTDGIELFTKRFGLIKTQEFIKLFSRVKLMHDANLKSRK